METSSKLGSVGRRVATEVARLRGSTPVRELSARLSALGRPILPSGITKIEQGQRRVDVDDLMALAIALKVTPTRLLLGPPPTDGTAHDPAHDEVWEQEDWVSPDGKKRVPTSWLRLAPELAMEPWEAWGWAQGESPLGEIWRMNEEGAVMFSEGEEERFRAANQPPPLRPLFGVAEDVQWAISRLSDAVAEALDQGLTEGQVEQLVRGAMAQWRREKGVREENRKRYQKFQGD